MEHGTIRDESRNSDIHEIRVKYRGKTCLVQKWEFSECNMLQMFLGRSPYCQINIPEELQLVSGEHLRIRIHRDKFFAEDIDSKNGTYLNGSNIRNTGEVELRDGDILRIDNTDMNSEDGVSIEYNKKVSGEISVERTYEFKDSWELYVGRNKVPNKECIVLRHPMVSKKHFRIYKQGSIWYAEDLNSTNGTYVEGRRIKGRCALKHNDSIKIVNAEFVFKQYPQHCRLDYTELVYGISIHADNIRRVVRAKSKGLGHKDKVLLSDIDLRINPGEFVAFVGGSGAGKTTLMKCLCGFTPATSGKVFINGEDFYANYERMKDMIGYVPQKDIVYDNLTVGKMLDYAAKLRMSGDTGPAERRLRVEEVLRCTKMEAEIDTRIGKLSGGQKKRISIATELISQPKVIFLDEPTSGLDPGMDKAIMNLLKDLSRQGTTVILVTHATANINSLCDKIVFLAKEEGEVGRLCFYGPPAKLLRHFGVDDISDIYTIIENPGDAKKAREQYDAGRNKGASHKDNESSNVKPGIKKHSNPFYQWSILTARYYSLIRSDIKTLAIIIGQAPLMVFILWLVGTKSSFDTYEGARKILFTLSFMAVLMGVLNSFLEVCKEREILKREYFANLKLIPYLLSKLAVLASFGIMQALVLVIGAFVLFRLPDETLLYGLPGDFLISVILIIIASTAMGILISSFSSTTELATLLMPVAIVPQLAFSGILFDLSGVTKLISNLVVARWSMSTLGCIFNINRLPLHIAQEYPVIAEAVNNGRIPDAAYRHEISALLSYWGVLAVIITACIALSAVCLKRNLKER
jgi:ABC-type multidrug transport system ATPase subunit